MHLCLKLDNDLDILHFTLINWLELYLQGTSHLLTCLWLSLIFFSLSLVLVAQFPEPFNWRVVVFSELRVDFVLCSGFFQQFLQELLGLAQFLELLLWDYHVFFEFIDSSSSLFLQSNLLVCCSLVDFRQFLVSIGHRLSLFNDFSAFLILSCQLLDFSLLGLQ